MVPQPSPPPPPLTAAGERQHLAPFGSAHRVGNPVVVPQQNVARGGAGVVRAAGVAGGLKAKGALAGHAGLKPRNTAVTPARYGLSVCCILYAITPLTSGSRSAASSASRPYLINTQKVRHPTPEFGAPISAEHRAA